MGVLNIKMSASYLKELSQIVNRYMPEAKILINSAGRFDLRQVLNLFKTLRNIISKPYRLIIGYDYYYKTENRSKFFLTRIIDSIDFSNPINSSLKTTKQTAQKYQYDIEVTEAQFESWGSNTDPGNKVRDLKFVLLRCIKNVLNLRTESPSVIRLWGIEYLAHKILNNDISEEHLQIIDLIKKINKPEQANISAN
jgi:hypothetical protein